MDDGMLGGATRGTGVRIPEGEGAEGDTTDDVDTGEGAFCGCGSGRGGLELVVAAEARGLDCKLEESAPVSCMLCISWDN